MRREVLHQNGFSPDCTRGKHQQGASMSLSDAEIDALEQLQEAIESGDVSLLRKLLNQTDLTNYPFAGTEDRTLLHLACIFGERECVVELLNAGADPNAVDGNGSTPLLGLLTSIFIPGRCNGSACLSPQSGAAARLFRLAVPPCKRLFLTVFRS